MELTNLFDFFFGIHHFEFRSWLIVINSLITIVNFAVIVAIILSIRKFRNKVSIQDQSRIAYLEEFKVHVKSMFQVLENITMQLKRIENKLDDRNKT